MEINGVVKKGEVIGLIIKEKEIRILEKNGKKRIKGEVVEIKEKEDMKGKRSEIKVRSEGMDGKNEGRIEDLRRKERDR